MIDAAETIAVAANSTTHFPCLHQQVQTAAMKREDQDPSNVTKPTPGQTPHHLSLDLDESISALNARESLAILKSASQSPAIVLTAWKNVLLRFVAQERVAFWVVASEGSSSVVGQPGLMGAPGTHLCIPAGDAVSDAAFHPYDSSMLEVANTAVEFTGSSTSSTSFDSFIDELVRVDAKSTSFLLLQVDLCAESLRLQWTPDLFAREYGATLIQVFIHTLGSTIGKPPTFSLPPSVSSPDPVRLVTDKAYLLHHLFEAQADAHPDAPAIRFLKDMEHPPTLMTYRQVEERANRLSQHLRASVKERHQGVSIAPDDIIPVYLPQSPDFYVSVLAVLKSGGAFLPLSDDMPLDRIEFIVGDVKAKAVILSSRLKESLVRRLKESGMFDRVVLVVLDEEEAVIDGFDGKRVPVALEAGVTENHLAYLQYTSGSTGKPKGTMIEHGSIVDSVLAHKPLLKWGADSSFLQFASVTFDVSIFEIFFPWAVGICLSGARRDVLLSDLEGVINQLGVTHMELTPTVAALLHPDRVPTVRTLLTIGEMLTQRVVDAWSPNGRLQAAYGPTEAAVHVSLTPPMSPLTKPINLGTPLSTCSWYVMPLDPTTSTIDPVAVGCLGELYLGGRNVGRGYLNRDEETRKAFVEVEGYGKLYRTGDLVRMLPDGTLDILGRINDEQVKLNGQRMELQEVTRVIEATESNSLPIVKEVATIVIKASSGITRRDVLVCFIVPSTSIPHTPIQSHGSQVLTGSSPDALRDTCRGTAAAKLPAFMVPTHFVILNALPRLPSGKTDKKGLLSIFSDPRVAVTQGGSRAAVDAEKQGEAEADPSTWSQTELAIARVVEKLTGVPITRKDETEASLRRDRSIVGYGIDSLMAIRACALLRSEERLENVSVSLVVQKATIAAIARALDERKGEASVVPADSSFEEAVKTSTSLVAMEGVDAVYPCTSIQEAMIAETFKSEDRRRYYNALVLSIHTSGDVDGTTKTITEAWSKIVASNDILRTGFMPSQAVQNLPTYFTTSAYLQIVWSTSRPPAWTVVRTNDVQTSVDDHLKESGVLSIENMHVPPISSSLLITDDANTMYLSIVAHHALYDGWSLELLVRDLEASLSGSKVSITARPQYRDIVKHNLSHPIPETSLQFWSSLMRGSQDFSKFPSLVAPTSSTQPVASTQLTLPTTIPTKAYESRCKDLTISPQVPLQWAWSRLLSAYTGSQDVIFGVVVSGRTVDVDGASEMMGPFLNTVPCRVFVPDEKSDQRRVVAAIQAGNVAMVEHQRVPLRKIREVGGGRRRGGAALFDSVVAYQKFEDGMSSGGRVGVVRSDDFSEQSIFLELEPTPTASSTMTLRIHFKPTTIPPSHAQIILEQMAEMISHDLFEPSLMARSPLPLALVALSSKKETVEAVAGLVGKKASDAVAVLGVEGDEILVVGAVGEVAFVDSVSSKPLVRTGHLGRMLSDRSISFAGSLQSRVQYNGTPIGLDTVVSTVLSTGVTNAAAIVVSRWKADRDILVCFIEGRADDGAAVFEGLRRRDVVSTLIPDYIVPVEAIPTDQSALEKMFERIPESKLKTFSSTFGGGAVVGGAAEDAIVAKIRGAFSAISSVPLSEISSTTSLYELGLDSVSAIQLVWKLRQDGFATVSVSDVMSHPSAGSLFSFIQAEVHKSVEASNSAVLRKKVDQVRSSFAELEERVRVLMKAGDDVEEIFPCTPLQEGMLAETVAEDDGVSQINWNHTVLEMKGDVDVGNVKSAWRDLVRTNSILRTFFMFLDREPAYPFVQVVKRLTEMDVDVVQLGSVQEAENAFGRMTSAHISGDETLAQPVRATLLCLPGKAWFVLSLHHAVYDGWSLALLLQQFNAAFSGSTLQALQQEPPAFRETVAWMRSLDASDAEVFWSKYLDGVKPTLLSSLTTYGIEDGSLQNVEVERRTSFTVSQSESACRRLETTMTIMGQAAWSKILFALSSASGVTAESVVFGTVWSGRTYVAGPSGVEHVTGPCFNTVPCCVRVDEEETLGDFLGRIHQRHLDVAPFQHTPLKDVQRMSAKEGRGKLFDTILVFQKLPEQDEESCWKTVRDVGISKFSIMLEILPESGDDGHFVLRATVDKRVMTTEHANAILENLDILLKSMIENPVSIPLRLLADSSSLLTIMKPQSTVPEISRQHQDQDFSGVSAEMRLSTERSIKEAIIAVVDVDASAFEEDLSIFQIGLDSIGVIRLASILRSRFGISLSFLDIMQNPSVGGMVAVWCARAKSTSVSSTENASAVASAAVEKVKVELKEFAERVMPFVRETVLEGQRVSAVYPCTPTQAAMVAQTSRDPLSYFNSFVYELESSTDVDKLRKSWEEVIRANDILRTCFFPIDSAMDPSGRHDFMQVVLENSGVRWTEISASSYPEVEELLERTFQEHVSTMAKLESPPLSFVIAKVTSSNQVLLALNIHHALYDGWSLRLILDDVLHAYKGKPLPSRVRNYSSAVATILSSNSPEGEEDRRAFWTGRLQSQDAPSFPDLSGTSEVLSGRHMEDKVLSISLSEVQKRCRAMGVTAQSVAQASWAVVLRAYADSEDVVFGHVLSGRAPMSESQEDLEQVVGPCLVTVPCKVSAKGGMLNREVVEALHQQNIEVHSFQHTPLRAISRWLGLRPGSSLFDTIFLYQKLSLTDSSNETRLWKELDGVNDVEYAVAVEFEPSPLNEISIRISAKKTVLSKAHTALLVRQLEAVFVDLLTRPDEVSGNIAHRLSNNMISIANKDAPLIPEPAGISYMHSWVEKFAEIQGDSSALEFAGRILDNGLLDDLEIVSYAQLNALANKIAHYLLGLGLKVEDKVPVCVDRSVAFYASILGVSKAGGVYVPIEPNNPLERKLLIARDVEAKVFLVSSNGASTTALRSGLSEGVQVVDVDSIKDMNLPETNPQVDIRKENLAYILYTSGTTGTPKGVLIEHGNVVQSMLAFQQLIPLEKSSRFLQFASCAFDVSIFELFLSWSFGACVCATTKDNLLRDLELVISSFRITHIDLTPSVASLVRRDNLPSLKLLVSGGEAITSQVLKEWGDGYSLVNAFGPSEVTIGCTMLVGVTAKAKPANIGKPFSNVSAWVMSSDGKPVLTGVAGELCVGGSLVGRGYLNRPEQTERSFQTLSGHGLSSPQPMYKTGDLARLLADGTIEYLGRSDDQVKIRGMRLQLGEINMVAAMGHESVTSAHTIVLENKVDTSASKQLVTFIVVPSRLSTGAGSVKATAEDLELSRSVLRLCRAKLPPHMVPSRVIVISSIPLGLTGKLDTEWLSKIYYDALDQIELQAPEDDTKEAEWTNAELPLRKVIAEVARVPMSVVGRETSIFELGIDSLTATHLARKLRLIGFDVQISELLMHPRIDDLLSFALKRVDASDSKISIGQESDYFKEFAAKIFASFEGSVISAADVDKVYPCTPLQQGMLYQSLSTNGVAYANRFHLRMNSDVNSKKLEQAWLTVIDKHEVLRSRFASTSADESVVQFAMKKGLFNKWKNCSVKTDEDLDKSLQAYADMATLLEPVKLCLFESVESSTKLLVLDIHHAVYDGWSLPAILEDVRRAYFDLPLPSRKPFSHILEYVTSVDMNAAKQFWKKTMDSCVPTLFPNLTGLLPFEEASDHVAVHSLKASQREVEAKAKEAGVTVQTILLSVWSKILSNYTGELDVVFGQTVSGRMIPIDGIDDIIGPCFNTIPVRVKLSPGQSNIQLAKYVQQSTMEGIPFQHTPLSSINSWAGLPNGQPLFNTLFLYQRSSEESKDLAKVPNLWSSSSPAVAALDYPLCVEIESNDNGVFSLLIGCKSNLVPSDYVSELAKQFDAELSAFIDGLDQPAASLDIAFEDHLNLFAISNETEECESGSAILHELFELSAKRAPDAIALEWVDNISPSGEVTSSCISYDELNRRANRLAHAITSRLHPTSPSPDTPIVIPIHISKSVDVYVALLAILKSGCAYLPIDPQLPLERKKFMIEDVSAPIILTTSEYADDFKPLCDVLAVDVADNFAAFPDGKLDVEVSPRHLAYILSTSGTTGTPKGVMIEHGSITQSVSSFIEKFSTTFSPDAKFFQLANIAFDVSLYEIWIPWSQGRSICSARPELILFNLEGAIRALRLNAIGLSPTLAGMIRRSELPSVELLLCGGEALTQRVLKEWGGSDGRLCNCYGPSECTVNALLNVRIESNVHPSVIGRRQRTCSIYVMNEDFQPVLKGSIGELCIGGSQVARGYWKRPELTETKFRTLTVSGHDDRVFLTGDLVRMLPDGSISFIGRKDDQVKRNGLRIELGEINAVLSRAHPDISDAVSIVCKHPSQQSAQIVSFIAMSPMHPFSQTLDISLTLIGQDPRTQELERAIAEASQILPSYMVPSLMFVASRIPVGLTGKADRKTLTYLYTSLSAEDIIYQEGPGSPDAWTENDLQIRRALAKVAQISEELISRDVSFFQLGLDSISAIRFCSALNQINFDVSVSDIMRNPTISKLGSHISKKKASHPVMDVSLDLQLEEYELKVRTAMASLQKNILEIEAIYPCTPLQEGMIAKTLALGAPMYINSVPFVIEEGCKMDQLLDAWRSVISSNQILRTSFFPLDSSFAQVVHTQSFIIRKSVDTSLKAAIESAAREIDLSDWRRPPLILTEVRIQDKNYLILTLHHALYDGFSLSMILDDVAKTYANEHVSRPQFQELSNHITSRSQSESEKYWTTLLKDHVESEFPVLSLPTGSSESLFSVELKANTSLSAIEGACRELGVTMLSVFQAAWGSLLSSYYGETDVIFGNIVSGRACPVQGVESVMGPAFNTIPVRFDMSQFSSGSDFLTKVHQQNADSMEHQFTPLRSIIRWTNKESSGGRQLFDTLLSVLGATTDAPSSYPWKVVEDGDLTGLEYPVSIEVQPVSGVIVLRGACQSSLMNEKHLKLLLKQFDQTIEALLSDASKPLKLFSKMSDRELSVYHAVQENSKRKNRSSDDSMNIFCLPRVSSESSDLRLPSRKSSTIKNGLFSKVMSWLRPKSKIAQLMHEGIEISDRRTPNGIALEIVSDSKVDTWTYARLNAFANKYARLLLSKGVKLEQLVPVCMDRSAVTFAVILGVLKAGCTYVPIDPEAPLERKRMIIDDTEAPLVVCSEAVFSTLNIPDSEKWRYMLADSTNVRKAVMEMSPQNLNLQLSPNHLAYAIYTSGTTGMPKGCLLEHGNAVSSLHSFVTLFKADASTRFFQFASISFDVSLAELFIPWFVGGTVVMTPRDEALADLEGTLARLMITHVTFTPTLAALVRPDTVPSLRKISCGGEKLTQAVIDSWAPTGKLFNAYGPSEVTIGVSLHPVSPISRPSTLGKVFENVSAFVAKPGVGSLEMLPKGAVGELCLGGSQVARGYLNRPSLTDAKFVSLSFSKSIHGSDRIYRTGDLVRMLEDGTIDFLGRCDKQVKVNGIRIELDEITSVVVGSHPTIRDATAIVARLDAQSRDQIVVFVAFRGVSNAAEVEDIKSSMELIASNQEALTDALKACREKLTRVMVPSWIIPLQSIPRSLTNKVDDKALSLLFASIDPAWQQALSEVYIDAEKSALEDFAAADWEAAVKTVRSVLSKASGVPGEQILLTSTIFHLGLDSISAVKLSSDFKEAGVKLAISEILRLETLQQIAAKVCRDKLLSETPRPCMPTEAKRKMLEDCLKMRLGTRGSRTELAQYLGVEEDQIEVVLPCAPGQLFTIAGWVNTNGGVFSNTFALASTAAVDADRLKKALSAVVSKNIIFRSAFVGTGEEDLPIIQVILKSFEGYWSEEVLSVTIESTEGRRLIESKLAAQRARPFDLKSPPLRVQLIRFKDERALLLLTLHHALYDGWSLRLLMSEIEEFYRVPGKVDNETASDFVDFIFMSTGLSEDSLESSKLYDSHEEFWSRLLGNVTPSFFPPQNLTSESSDSARSLVVVEDAIPNFDAVQKFYQDRGVAMQSVFAAAWGKLQSQYSDSSATSQVFGVYHSGRVSGMDGSSFDSLNAPCMTVVPMAISGASQRKLVDISKDVQQTFLKFQSPEAQAPLNKISSWLGLDGRPLFNVCFNFLKFPTIGNSNENQGLFEPFKFWSSNVQDIHRLTPQSANTQFMQSLEIAKGNAALDCVKIDLDVEVAIQDGKVTVGLSNIPSLLSRSQAHDMISELCSFITSETL
ncbi:hypothetical protein HDU67_008425 [Dinochytrium kinnereticum]|nr:hypothetical protein HDU67_008425 [Dinochytrium kinnereticum]